MYKFTVLMYDDSASGSFVSKILLKIGIINILILLKKDYSVESLNKK